MCIETAEITAWCERAASAPQGYRPGEPLHARHSRRGGGDDLLACSATLDRSRHNTHQRNLRVGARPAAARGAQYPALTQLPCTRRDDLSAAVRYCERLHLRAETIVADALVKGALTKLLLD
jgi:hypothetical protein